MQPLLEMKNITKIYDSGVRANDEVCFSLEEGEIHAIAGENGAGKSTLMKILCGAEKPTSGEIFLRGEKVSFHSPRDAQAHGIGMVWQHFMLVNEFPAYRNIYLGNEMFNKLGFLRDREMIAAAMAIAEKYSMPLDVTARCADLNVGQAQKVEILKVLARGAKILILDEPTAVLTPQETDELFRQLLLLKADGCSVVVITHKLNEIKRICDRVSILRAGKSMGVHRVADVSEEDISRLMVGAAVSLETEKSPARPADDAVEVCGLTVPGKGGKNAVNGISFRLRYKEIVCLAGVEGNGQRETVQTLCGLNRKYGGSVRVKGQDIAGMSVRRVRDLGVAHIPEDRIRTGCDVAGSVYDNLIALDYVKENKWGFLRERTLKKRCREQIEKYSIKGTVSQKLSYLSGGNMQKVVVARELESAPSVVIADQPTRGIDVGAISFIHKKLVEMRDAGCAVLLVSADLGEVYDLADRILVFHEGEITAEIADVKHTDEEQLGRYMLGVERMVIGNE